MIRRSAIREALVSALVLCASLVVVGVGSSHQAPGVCGTLGLDRRAVERTYGLTKEIADQQGTPVCEVVTRNGKAYVSVYPARDAAALRASWEFGIDFKAQSLGGLGGDATCLYTARYRQEALGFATPSHYVWMTAAGSDMHSELTVLAGAIYATLR